MRNERGISLLEVLVAMILISIGLLGLAPLVVLSVDANSTSQDALAASALAAEKIELYQNADSLPTAPFQEEEGELDGGFTRTTRLWDNSVDTLLPDDICQLEVQVTWVDKMGKFVVPAESMQKFLKDGGVTPSEGGKR